MLISKQRNDEDQTCHILDHLYVLECAWRESDNGELGGVGSFLITLNSADNLSEMLNVEKQVKG